MEFLQANILWVAAAVISGSMLLWPLIIGARGGNDVSPQQATLLLNRENAVVIDVRETAEWSAGHIANARHVALSQFDKRIDELDKLKLQPIIVCCASGGRSASACNKLRKAGFEKVYNLAGGIGAWTGADLPLTTK